MASGGKGLSALSTLAPNKATRVTSRRTAAADTKCRPRLSSTGAQTAACRRTVRQNGVRSRLTRRTRLRYHARMAVATARRSLIRLRICSGIQLIVTCLVVGGLVCRSPCLGVCHGGISCSLTFFNGGIGHRCCCTAGTRREHSWRQHGEVVLAAPCFLVRRAPLAVASRLGGRLRGTAINPRAQAAGRAPQLLQAPRSTAQLSCSKKTKHTVPARTIESSSPMAFSQFSGSGLGMVIAAWACKGHIVRAARYC